MFYAAREGKNEIIKYFITKNVNINHMDNKKLTALSFAKKFKRTLTIKLLTDNGAKCEMTQKAI